ncbi:MAG TPA: hypothetical protein VJ732_05480 [Bryobacteraceae bacterium]|nr:hypothetical protein [Bryobacteraceae bacterium]
MFRVKLILAVAALVFVQLQCVAACAGQCVAGLAGDESVPPCHRHHSQPHGQDPASCAHEFMTAPDLAVQGQHVGAAPVPAPAAVSVALPSADFEIVAPRFAAFSPPAWHDLSSVVLRI